MWSTKRPHNTIPLLSTFLPHLITHSHAHPRLTALHLRQLLDGRGELEVLREQLARMRIHQLVRLPNGHVGHAGNVADLLLRALVLRRLRGHVDGGRGHRDGRAAGHDVHVDRFARDVRGGALHHVGQLCGGGHKLTV